jgi:pilus assembly protein Flp/PilA
MKSSVHWFLKSTKGQDLVEYALVAGMVAVAAVATVPVLTNVIANLFNNIGSVVSSATI